MLTRSQVKKQEEIILSIDFDDSSRTWMQNKRKIGGGSYEYIQVSSHIPFVRRSERIKVRTENKKK